VRTVAFDPGTKLGWAWREDDVLGSGWTDCSVGRHESAGMRFVKAKARIEDLIDGDTDLVVYEDVRAHRGTYAAQIYGGIVSLIQTRCIECDVPYMGAPVGKVKKHATGKGNADKVAMVDAAQKAFGPEVTDDNEADALWVLDWALNQDS